VSSIQLLPPTFPLQTSTFHEILSSMTSTAPAEMPDRSMIDPVRVHAALGNKMRWQMMRIMADGTMLTALRSLKGAVARYRHRAPRR